MPKCQPSTAFVVLATPPDAASLLFHIDGGNRSSLKFFSMYVFWNYEHNSSILSISLESRASCSHTSGISSTTSLKEDLTFSSFLKAKAGISFEARDNSGFEWYKFFSPSSPILRIKFCGKWKKHPDIVALGSAFSEASIATIRIVFDLLGCTNSMLLTVGLFLSSVV